MSQLNSPLQGFVPVDDWPIQCADRWPPGRLRDTAKLAYDLLAQRGDLLPVGLSKTDDGAILVRYRGQIPQEWILELLKKAEQEIKYKKAGQ